MSDGQAPYRRQMLTAVLGAPSRRGIVGKKKRPLLSNQVLLQQIAQPFNPLFYLRGRCVREV
jgi:hypothetical protein